MGGLSGCPGLAAPSVAHLGRAWGSAGSCAGTCDPSIQPQPNSQPQGPALAQSCRPPSFSPGEVGEAHISGVGLDKMLRNWSSAT